MVKKRIYRYIVLIFFIIMATAQESVTIEELRGMRQADLKSLADSVGVEVSPSMRKAEIFKILAAEFELDYPEGVVETEKETNNEVELAKIALGREKELCKKELAILQAEREKEREQFEIRRLELELQLSQVEPKGNLKVIKSEPTFDVTKYIKLVPKFSETDVETYFLAFEKVANCLNWPVRYWTILLQSVLVGKAQEVFSSLSDAQSQDYNFVKKAILSAYELVPEAYRQKFRNLQRQSTQTYVEFAREKELLFDKWYRSLEKEKEFEKLREIVLMEEFKNSVPLYIKTHLNEHKVFDLNRAAMSADDYELTHKINNTSFGLPP